jgi:tRNA G18 (ribose-2'-O)-methylase SpoU
MIINSVQFFNVKNYHVENQGNRVVIAAWKLNNPENIGHIIRLAHNVNAKKLLFVVDNTNVRLSKIKKIAGFSFDQMDWEFVSEEDFWNQIPEGHKIIGIETVSGSVNIYKTKLPEKLVLLAGSEKYGLPEEIIKRCDQTAHIPVPGDCKSLNVSHAIAVAVFEWYRQMNFDL